jgi:hypothetical protein
MARSGSSSTTLLIAIVLVITFPIWFAIGAALFGLTIGLLGAIVGIVAGLFGLMIGLIALPFKLLFGWGDSGWHTDFGLPFFHTNNGFMIIVLLVIAFILFRKGRN